MVNYSKIIGIDVGTYNSAVAYRRSDGEVRMLISVAGETEQGKVVPSFIEFDVLGKDIVAWGKGARDDLGISPQRIVWGVKRLVGRAYHQVEDELQRFLYPIKRESNGEISIVIGQNEVKYSPIDITTKFLKKIKEEVIEAPFNNIGKVDMVVVSRPAYFDAEQIKQIKKAAEDAELGEVHLIPEPVAAALAYSADLNTRGELAMTIDWGAGTLDIVITTLVKDKEGMPRIQETQPAYGDLQCGGLNMDDELLDWVLEYYKLYLLKEYREKLIKYREKPINYEDLPPESEYRTLNDLRIRVESMKLELSSSPLRVPAVRQIRYGGRPVTIQMKREDLEKKLGLQEVLKDSRKSNMSILKDEKLPILIKAQKHIEYMLRAIGAEAIDRVFLVGGPMHMPCVRQMIAKIFAKNPRVSGQLKELEKYIVKTGRFPVDPMEVVVKGASMGVEVISAPSYDYGILLNLAGYLGGKTILHKGSRVPCEVTEKLFTEEDVLLPALIPVSLYKTQIELQGKSFETIYTKMGSYEFAASGPFEATLRADKDTIITAVFSDKKGHSLVLRDLSTLENKRVSGLLSLEDVKNKWVEELVRYYTIKLIAVSKMKGSEDITISKSKEIIEFCLIQKVMQLATQTLAKELNVSDKEAINILNLVFAGVDPDIITEQRKAHSLLTIAKNRLEEASYNHRKVVEEAKNKLEKALEKSFEESSKDIHVELHNDNEQLLHALILAGLLADEDKDILSKS